MRRNPFVPVSWIVLSLCAVLSAPVLAKVDKMKLSDIPEETPKKKKKKEPLPPADATPEDRRQMMQDVAADFYEKGESMLKTGQLAQAKTYYERVLVLVPGHTAAQSRVNQINLKLESQTPVPTKKAVKDPSAQLMKKLEWEMEKFALEKDWPDTYGSAKKIIALQPGHVKARQRLAEAETNLFEQAVRRGSLREKAGELQSAVDAYQVALTYRSDPEIHDKVNALQSKLMLGNKKKSEEMYLEALRSTQAGKKEEAVKLCQQALKIDPSNIQARRMLDRIKGKN